MKRIFTYLALAATVTFAASCDWKAASPEFHGEDTIALSLAFEAPTTKAKAVGLENTVTSVEYFFYSNVTGTPVYRKYVSEPTLSENAYSVSLVVGEGDLADKTLNDFFPNGADCEFFAVFNYPEEIGDLPLAEVKNKAVTNTFAHTIKNADNKDVWVVTEDGEANLYPKYFVMTGQATLTAAPDGIDEKVEMKRIAAKVSFVVNVTAPKPTTVGGVTETWTPMLKGKNPRIYLVNAVGNALVGGADPVDEEAGTGPVYPETLDQFEYAPVILNFGEGTTVKSPAFYTFPLAWEGGSDMEINCKLIIPWSMERTENGVVTYSTERELYYKVLFPEQIIESNNWYVYTINATFLGHEGQEPTIDIVAEKAQVLPWKGTTDVNPVISAAKYLSVEKGARDNEGQHPLVIYTTGTTIQYAASDKVTMVIKNIYQPNLKTRTNEYLVQDGSVVQSTLDTRNANKKASEPTWTADLVRGWIEHNADGSIFELSHILNSDLTSNNMDATPYYYEIELQLAGDTQGKYTKTVDIIQYPQVYIVEDPNRKQNSTGGVWVDGGNTANSKYGGVHGLTGLNKNGSMYVLTISVSSDYIIGDPRATESDLLGRAGSSYYGGYYNYWAEGRWTENSSTDHQLTYYYPAAYGNNAGTANMIAPKLRVASSYGVCSTGISEDNARIRCAGYQEDGIPAGRWRLPTSAEVRYICTLSSLGRIPYLFGNAEDALDPITHENIFHEDSYYWTANGRIRVNNGEKEVELVNSGSQMSVRCVYDEWYWGNAVDDNGNPTRPLSNNDFTWGDKQR